MGNLMKQFLQIIFVLFLTKQENGFHGNSRDKLDQNCLNFE